MTTKRTGGREAITHYKVERRIESKFGKFTLLELQIDTGRTHQIRVHMASLGHPVVGDTNYGASGELKARTGGITPLPLSLPRNFLHAMSLQLEHPRTGAQLSFVQPMPPELKSCLQKIEAG